MKAKTMVHKTGSECLPVHVATVAPHHEHARVSATRAQVPLPDAREPVANSLLAALPAKDCRRLVDAMEQVVLARGEILAEPGERIQYVYFPDDALVSLLALVHRRQALEVGLVGREGMIGIPLALETSISPVRALVQRSGEAMRMKAAAFLAELRQSPALQRELHRYTYALMAQITRTAACNRFHVLEARLAGRLLMTQDRLQSSTFRLTQEFLAQMLGVRRVGVTKAARALQQDKLIDYRRGDITILDRNGLEAAACSCYKVVNAIPEAAPARSAAPSPAPAAPNDAERSDLPCHPGMPEKRSFPYTR